MISDYLKMLGMPVRDRVTRAEGVVTSIDFNLYGCVMAIVQPPGRTKDGGIFSGEWFDVKRLEVLGAPVMGAPAFAALEFGEEQGGDDRKPMPPSGPA